MHPGLANGILSGASWVDDIFEPGFQTANKWCDYLLTRFGGHLTVNNILNRSDHWSAADFQALYVACWTFFPLEKGSYMIPLTDTQRASVKKGYETLGVRMSSHLHKHGRSAGSGWRFLKGYAELLVQMEGGGKHSPEISPHLFLKCEGSPAVSWGHVMSLIEKMKKGHGAVANEALQKLAKNQMNLGIDLGITERAAENYSKDYQAVLRAMEKSGDTVSVQDAVVEMFNLCRVAMANQGSINPSLSALLGQSGLQGPMSETGVGGLDNAQVATMIEQVLLPFAKAAGGRTFSQPRLNNFLKALVDAEGDMKQIAVHLRADEQRTGKSHSVRYFQEIVVAPPALDSALDAAYKMLRA